MFTFPKTPGPRRARAATASLLFLVPLLVWPAAARAQENATSPPPVLQWPVREPGPRASADFAVSLLRSFIELGANEQLCKLLMKEAGEQIPPDFTFDMCPARFREQIAARRGKVRWVSGARPTECGAGCVGRPTMTSSTFLDRPNTIFASLPGHLDFRVDVPNSFDRNVRFGYEVQFHCLTKGKREGDLTVRVVFDRPFVLEGGILESLADFFLPGGLSNAVEAGIRRKLSTPGTRTTTLGRCTSIGVNRGEDAADDLILFNRPQPGTGRGPRPTGDTVLNRRSVTVRFTRVTRKPVFNFTPPAEPGQFFVFLNGVEGGFPDLPRLNLPPTGGSAEINLCKTIDMDGADRLQIIIANSHGGAVWSQFAPNASFGAGPPRSMTTSRTIMVAGTPGPPDPITGKPGGTKPQPLLLREFELHYTIEFHRPPDEVIATTPVTGGGQTPRPCRKI